MNTGYAPSYIRHYFKVQKIVKSYTVFEFDNSKPIINLLTDEIRIEQFRHLSNGKGFKEYLRIKNESSWNKSKCITGLKVTTDSNIYYGDMNNKTSLLIFQFSNDRQNLILDIYRGYYPFKMELLQNIIKAY